MSNPEAQGLKGNPKRQATPALRGYAYQAWQSALTWVSLRGDEVLFLEGAEDLDVIVEGEATTVQVKDTNRSGTVTLNHQDVLKSIIHYWEHQANNPQLLISFHFLTTSKRGREQGDPFGEINGLDYWDNCRRNGTDLAPLREFFAAVSSIPDHLRDFIKTSSDEVLRERLIRRIRWDTDNGPQEHIQELVKTRLIEYGSRVEAVPASDSLRVLPFLYKHIWDVIIRPADRRLTHANFVQLFQDVTTEPVSAHELRHLRSRSALMSAISDLPLYQNAGDASRSLRVAQFDMGGLAIFDRLARRDDLVAKLRARLDRRGLLVLRGSTGMGKSTLASQVVKATGEEWLFSDLRGLNPEQIRDRLINLSLHGRQEEAVSHVLDDLNFDRGTETYLNALMGLIYTASADGRKVILTTQGDLPTRIRLIFDLAEETVVDVPALADSDVKEVFQNFGCPDEVWAGRWAGIIRAKTAGHPLLVHAEVKNLEMAGWRAPGQEDLLPSSTIEEVRRDVRKRLQDQIPKAARRLAFRLSIFYPYFKRSHALYLAEHPPAIPDAGEAFDMLLGPWVERLKYGYHRLSPLLQGAANQMFAPGEVKQLHGAAAEAMWVERSITPSDFSGILMNGIQGDVEWPLFEAYSASIQISREDWPTVSSEAFLFAYLSLSPGQLIYPPDPLISLMMRQVQFRVATESVPGKIPALVAERWDEELDSFDEGSAYVGAKLIWRSSLSYETLMRPGVRLPVRLLIKNAAKFLAEIRRAGERLIEEPRLQQILACFNDDVLEGKNILLMVSTRCKSVSDLTEMLMTLATLEPHVAQNIWAELGTNNHTSMLFIDGAWLNESKKETPDWRRCLQALNRASTLGLSVRADSFVAASYRAKAIVLEEYLKDTAGAFAALEEGGAKLGGRHLVLDDYRAKILSLERIDEEAVEMWEALTPEMEQDGNPSRAFSYRAGAISSSRLGRWPQAASFAFRAEGAIRQAQWKDEVAACFKADGALATWKAGDFPGAIRLMAEVIDELSARPDSNSSAGVMTLRRKIEHTLEWMKRSFDGDAQSVEPPCGWFSDFDEKALPESGVEKGPVDFVYLWYHLALVELAAGGSLAVERFVAIADDSPLGHLKFSAAKLRSRKSLQDLRVESLVEEYVCYMKRLSEHAVANSRPPVTTQGSEFLMPLLFVALIRISVHNDRKKAPLANWRSDSEIGGLLDTALTTWLDFVYENLDKDEAELIAAMRDPRTPSLCRFVAALFLLCEGTVDPGARLQAGVWLISNPQIYGFWQEDVEQDIGRLISVGWLEQLKKRYALLSPNLTVPEIAKACADNSSGFKKGARVLLAARAAVKTRVDGNLLNKLKEMAG